MATDHADYARTYFALRLMLCLAAVVVAAALPLSGRYVFAVPVQPSLSAYYFTDLGNIFVGGLCAVGFGLIAYKGFSWLEDRALDLGGLCALGVALFPMNPDDALGGIHVPCDAACHAQSALYDRTAQFAIDSKLHVPFAVSFFVVIGVVMFACSHRTLELVTDRTVRRSFIVAYWVCGLVFVGAMVAVFFLAPKAGQIIGVEIAGVLSFAVYWGLKTAECLVYGTDTKLARSAAKRPLRHLWSAR